MDGPQMLEEIKAAWKESKPWKQVVLASVCTFGVLVVYGVLLTLLERLVPGGAGAFTFGFVLLLFIIMFWTLMLVVSRDDDDPKQGESK